MRLPQNVKWFIFTILAMLCLPQFSQAGIEWRTLREVKLSSQAIDVAASSDGKLIFALTPGKILVYSAVEDAMVDQITVDTIYTNIATSNDQRIILSAADPATLSILKYNRVYDINITNRPFRGPKDAKVTLIVFDDYQ